MDISLIIISIIVLGVIIYQDFKYRAISWFLLPILLAAFVVKGFLNLNFEEYSTYFFINLSLLLVNLLGATLIISLKEKRLKNIVNSYLGLGDVLFFLVLTTAFSPINFIVFYLGSILLTGTIYGIVVLVNKNNKTLIPLAGTMSITLVVALIAQQFTPLINFYNDFVFLF